MTNTNRYRIMREALERIAKEATDPFAVEIAKTALPSSPKLNSEKCSICGKPTRRRTSKFCSDECAEISWHSFPRQIEADKRRAAIIQMWQDKKTKTEIAKQFGLSLTRVSRIIHRHTQSSW